jgi:hypothetical protein
LPVQRQRPAFPPREGERYDQAFMAGFVRPARDKAVPHCGGWGDEWPSGDRFHGGVAGAYSFLTLDWPVDDNDRDAVFGWQASAGVRYNTSESISRRHDPAGLFFFTRFSKRRRRTVTALC